VVVWKCSLPTPSQGQHFHLLSQLMAQAIHNAKTQQRSIHLNVPLDVPLEAPLKAPSDTTVSLVPADVLQLARQLANGHFPTHQRHRATEDYSQLATQISDNLIKAKNPLIVFGELPLHWGKDFSTQQMVMESLLAQLKTRQVTFFADAGSSFKYQLPLVARALPCPDHPEALELWKTQNFDFILHIGGRTISKNYYQFIQQLPAATNLMALSIRDEIEDPSGRFSQRASINLFQFFHVWLEKLKLLPENNRQTENSLLPLWLQLENNKREIIDSAPLSYPQVSKTLIECLPAGTVLFLGNSTVPRTFDSYIHGHQQRQLSIVTQRGVSGIEGNLSTTMGLRDNLPQEIPVAAVIGDIAMIHDLNALLELSHSTQPLVLFIVNNFGGGIFNLLPVARETEIMHLLTTPHQWQFAPIARAMNLHSIQVTTKEELLKATKLAFELNHPCLIEILINDQQNQEVYKKLRTVRL
jgi:2-succinyl-5-enolpyruvyl-6-hydroxy-3-cyclohexene-1-carboxylate synthase